jgi:hypothetical protein
LSLQSDAYCRRRLAEWLEQQQAEVPTDQLAVVQQWWPTFKRQLRLKVQDLNQVAKGRRETSEDATARGAAATELVAARQQVEDSSDVTLPAAIDRMVAARTAFAQIQQAEEAIARQQRQQQWVHIGERPNPVMTSMLRPPKGATFIAGLHAPGSGHLVVDGVSLAGIVARRYADISAAPQVQQQAQQTVLQAMVEHGTRLSDRQAEQLGADAVTAEEVAAAIKGIAPGKAPGLDGIPGELFRQYRAQMAPLLAQLYSAIGGTGACPADFLHGVVVPVLKPGGIATDVDSYRPLQLLDYDYRLLAKVLANRLLQVAGDVIDPAQCAFLQQRQIGDSVRLLQMLPALLAAENNTAIAAFIDFRKAYDTVSREFLCAAADTLGVGSGFVRWMKVLLTDTRSCAVVNGFQSAFYVCEGGVRQGCPLAPLMYLFAGQALLCHLRKRGVGIDLAGERFVATQYADDVEPLLPDDNSVSAFVRAMEVYGDATGQRMQPAKSQLLPMGGAVVQDRPPVAGIQVVSRAKSLGIIFGSRGVVGVDWGDRMGIVRQRMQKISRLPNLSAFGRAFAVNGYALSTLLYHAQFAGVLPSEHSANLVRWSAALVDRGLGPEDSLRRPPGIPTDCMDAHPSEGGFGLMPVRAHLFARWAVDAVQFMFGAGSKPWVAAGRALLKHHAPQVPGGDTWALALCDRQRLFLELGGRVLPQPLRSMAVGLRALPPMSFVGESEEPGPWCYHIPLWSNPVVVQLQDWDWFGQQRGVSVALEFALPGLFGLPELQCVGQGVYWLQLLEDIAAETGDPGSQNEGYRMHILGPLLHNRRRYVGSHGMHAALRDLRELVLAVPLPWQVACRAVLRARQPLEMIGVTAVQIAVARARVVADMGWRTRDGEVVRPASLTVAVATRLQSLDSHIAIAERHQAFTFQVQQHDAHQPPFGNDSDDDGDEGLLPPVKHVLHRWWKLKVPNFYKEAAWRLSLDAFATAARMSVPAGGAPRCCAACGAVNPGYAHHFWSCPIADTVRQEVESQLRAKHMLAADRRVLCAQLWLGEKPHYGMHRMVWDMVCLAAIHAMNVGRQAAWSVADRVASPDLVADVVKRIVKAAFWNVLADFAVSAVVPMSARNGLLTNQPFLAWPVVVVRGSGLRVVRY